MNALFTVARRFTNRLLLFLLLSLSAQGLAAEEQQVEPQTQPASEKPEQLWLDTWHSSFSESLDYTAQQLDEFFALEGSDDHQDARAEGRVRFGWEPRTRDLDATDFRFRIRVKLPALKDRVDLLLSDDDSFNREDTIRAARDDIDDNQNSASLALRYQKEENSPISHRLGIGRGGQFFAKSQYEQDYRFSSELKMDYDGEVYYYTRDEFGAELGVNFTFSLPDDKYFRFKNRYFYRDRFNDWLWRHEIQFLRPLTPKSAVLYTLVTKGLSQPNYHVNEVYTSMRWRTNYLRSWLFFEVEPFVIWLKKEHFSPSYGVAVRFEFYYGKA